MNCYLLEGCLILTMWALQGSLIWPPRTFPAISPEPLKKEKKKKLGGNFLARKTHKYAVFSSAMNLYIKHISNYPLFIFSPWLPLAAASHTAAAIQRRTGFTCGTSLRLFMLSSNAVLLGFLRLMSVFWHLSEQRWTLLNIQPCLFGYSLPSRECPPVQVLQW